MRAAVLGCVSRARPIGRRYAPLPASCAPRAPARGADGASSVNNACRRCDAVQLLAVCKGCGRFATAVSVVSHMHRPRPLQTAPSCQASCIARSSLSCKGSSQGVKALSRKKFNSTSRPTSVVIDAAQDLQDGARFGFLQVVRVFLQAMHRAAWCVACLLHCHVRASFPHHCCNLHPCCFTINISWHLKFLPQWRTS